MIGWGISSNNLVDKICVFNVYIYQMIMRILFCLECANALISKAQQILKRYSKIILNLTKRQTTAEYIKTDHRLLKPTTYRLFFTYRLSTSNHNYSITKIDIRMLMV